jgi:flagellar motor switch protein FliN
MAPDSRKVGMEKIRIAVIEKTIEKSIVDAFGTMLSMDLVKVGQSTDPALTENRFAASVHFTGAVIGTLSLQISHRFATMVTAAMLGTEVDAVDSEEEIKDVLGELTHIVAGSLKSDFVKAELACMLSTPTIVRGSEFKIDTGEPAGTHKWIYRCESNELVIEINVREDSDAPADFTGMDALSSDVADKKINEVDIATTVIDAVVEGFHPLLSMTFEPIEDLPAGFSLDKRTVGSVSFSGDVQGMVNLQINDAFAHSLTAAMLGNGGGTVPTEDAVFDLIREMSTIVGGGLRSAFVDAGLSCVLSHPSIANGVDFSVEPLNIINTRRFLFKVNDQVMMVDVGIQQDTGQPTVGHPGTARPADTETSPLYPDACDFSNLQLIMDIPLEVTVELGRTQATIGKLLKMNNSSVVRLRQLEGEPVDLLVNDTLVAKGEVLVENEKYGIRIVEVVSRSERVKSLQ